MPNRKIIIYVAMSLDGYIAGENDNLDFLSAVEQPGEDYGYSEFLKTVDTVIMGRKTYDKVMSLGIPFPHKEKKCYVLSKTRTGNDDNVEYYSGDIARLIEQLRQSDSEVSNIFVDGGAEIDCELMRLDLIDRWIISIIPCFLGSGVRLFKAGIPEQKLGLINSITYSSGLVQLWYDKIDKK